MLSFFFSSRRRHTRLQGDWSSDVCSSDLVLVLELLSLDGVADDDLHLVDVEGLGDVVEGAELERFHRRLGGRSEERRVGKECSPRWSRCDGKGDARRQVECGTTQKSSWQS